VKKDIYGVPQVCMHFEWDENVLKMREHSKESCRTYLVITRLTVCCASVIACTQSVLQPVAVKLEKPKVRGPQIPLSTQIAYRSTIRSHNGFDEGCS
jgi:hypothetical protein